MKQYSDLKVYGNITQEAAQGTGEKDVVLYPALTNGLAAKVTGPNSAVSGNVVVFDGTTGKLVSDSGKTLGASIPAPDSNNAGKAIVVNSGGTGYEFGEAGKVDGVKLGDASASAVTLTNKYAIIPAAASTSLGVVKMDTAIGDGSRTDVTISESGIKSFVNSSISTNTATFRGNFNAVSELGNTQSAVDAWTDPPTSTVQSLVAGEIASKMTSASITPTNNDYVFVAVDQTPTGDAGTDWYWRFKYNGTAWEYEYTLNNSSYTQAQWNAINSGITSTKVGNYDTHIADTKIHVPTTTTAGKVLTSANNAAPVWKTISGSGYSTDSSGNIVITNTTYSGGTKITLSSGAFNHDTTSRTDTTSTATATHGGTFTAVDSVTTDTTGHVTAINVKTVTLPSDVDQKVKQNLKGTSDTGTYPIIIKNSTTKTDSPTGEVNYVAAVYIQPSTGAITATKFVGTLNGNADTATNVAWSGITSNPFGVTNVTITES